MKRIIAALVFLFVGAAHAQVPRPACIPGVNGYPVDTPKIFSGEVGRHVFWFCSDSKGAPPQMHFLNCLHGSCSDALMGAVISAVTRASARVGTAHSAWDAHVVHGCGLDVLAEETPRGALCRETGAIYLQHRESWPK
jgi:hypothetical protein